MTVRDAGAADASAIAAIWNHYIRETLATFNSSEKTADEVRDLIRARAEEGRAFLVWEEDGRVRGFATYFQFRGGAGYARTAEHTVQLAPGAGGRGAGRALMTAIEDHARASGHHVIYAGVSSADYDDIV